MASTTFVDGETLIEASWLNDVNAVVYTPGTSTAADIANVPAGSIAATDVQTALNELDAEKQPLDAELTALATSTAAANKIPYFTGATTAGTLDWNSASALANGATTISSNTVIKAAIDAMDIDTQVTPSTSDNVLTSNGTNWTSAAPALKAWCTFDGTTAGTNAPTAGSNVTSVTRNGTGDYTINFTTNISDANFAVFVSASRTASPINLVCAYLNKGVSSVDIRTGNISATATDMSSISVSIYR